MFEHARKHLLKFVLQCEKIWMKLLRRTRHLQHRRDLLARCLEGIVAQNRITQKVLQKAMRILLLFVLLILVLDREVHRCNQI
ncbi:hypothetical protein LINPERPRIM_LOCUS18777 [Linum perenne]